MYTFYKIGNCNGVQFFPIIQPFFCFHYKNEFVNENLAS
jgi:hypothetical protein